MEHFNSDDVQQKEKTVSDNGSLVKHHGVDSPSYRANPRIIIDQFPKEFNRNVLASADWRFLAILLISVCLHAVGIYYLFKHMPQGIDDSYITKIQNQYASLFLSDFEIEKKGSQIPANELMTTASEWARNLVEETYDPSKVIVNTPKASSTESGTSPIEPSYEKRSQIRKSTADSRRRSMAVLREDVENVGLLGIITSGSGLVSTAVVEDILSHADTSSMQIKERIRGLKGLRVPRPGVDYFGKDAKSGEVFVAEHASRGRRVNSSGINAEDFVANLAETQDKGVERNETFEKVSNRSLSFLGTRKNEEKVFQRRTAEQIREVVLAHNPAIQDCYRHELKFDPTLRGKVSVRFTIDVLGRVSEATILNSTMNIPRMESCILEKIKRWNDFGQVVEEQGELSIRHTYVFGY